MPVHLSSLQLEELTPLLGPLARMIARDMKVLDTELRALLLGSDTELDESVVAEMRRWAMLLEQLREQPTVEMRTVTEEALRLRGVAQASAALAAQLVTERVASGQGPASGLVARPARIDFGTLRPRGSAEIEVEIEGGAGEIVSDSDQVTVSPCVFGPGVTRVNVSVASAHGGTLWTKIRLISGPRFLDIPVVALFFEPEPDPAPVDARSQRAHQPPPQNRVSTPTTAQPPSRQRRVVDAQSASIPPVAQTSMFPASRGSAYVPPSARRLLASLMATGGLIGIAASLKLPWVDFWGDFSYSLDGGPGAWSRRWQLADWWQNAPDYLDALIIIATLLIGVLAHWWPTTALAAVRGQPRVRGYRLILMLCGATALGIGVLETWYINQIAYHVGGGVGGSTYGFPSHPAWPATGLIALMLGGAALVISSRID